MPESGVWRGDLELATSGAPGPAGRALRAELLAFESERARRATVATAG